MGDTLLQEADVIKADINALRNNVKTLQLQHKQALFALTPEQTNKISLDVQKITEDANSQINKIKGKIDALRRSADATGEHMRHNMAESLSGKFAEVLQQYQKAQTEYGEKIKAKMIQKVKIVHPQATNDEIEEAIDNGQVDKMFAQTTLDGAYMQGQAKNAMAYVQDRHRDIKAIEASVRELNQLFVDMNILVHSSGVMLDNIQESVNSAVLDTGYGADSLGKAVKEQKKGRKKLYIILFILVIILVLVLAIGLGVGLPKK